ncbi:hypothetical protein Fcan01_25354 [Folsomia candida]|uniref:Uncharacterized protein n=1 Tax=Folsomia candida TaxID=158441 RepID=A0A226D5R1_FOLCA|nr:hypothetical protein Fcan01_25354 [Folsomia candida]
MLAYFIKNPIFRELMFRTILKDKISPLLYTISLLIVLFLHFAPTECSSVHVHNAQPRSRQIEITHYLAPFENCNNIIVVSRNIQNLKSHRAPIILFTTPYSDLLRFPVLRRNVSHYCSASFRIMPNPNNPKATVDWNHGIKTSFGLQYFILVTNSKSTFQQFIEKLGADFYHYKRKEIMIIDVTLDVNGVTIWPASADHVTFYYHNMYHHEGISVSGNPSRCWIQVQCEGHDCFDELQIIGETVSQLNKYFWEINNRAIASARWSNEKKPLHKKSPTEGYFLTDLIESKEFWLPHDFNRYSDLNITPFYYFPTLNKFFTSHSRPFEFVIEQVQTERFLSCYKVKPDSFILAALTDPFDISSWICIVLSLMLTSTILTALLATPTMDGVIFMIGIFLENSVMDRLIKVKTRFHITVGLRLLVGVCVLLTGTVLVNWYKTLFTMEMIVPAWQTSPWETLFEIQVIMPFNLVGIPGVQPPRISYLVFFATIRHIFFPFSYEIDQFREVETGQSGVKKMATRVENTFNVGIGIKPTFNVTNYTAYVLKMENISYHTMLPISPFKPIQYEETDRFMDTVSACQKIAYLDT